MNSTLEQFQQQVVAGRGFWCGLFVEESGTPDQADTPVDIVGQHVTLLHFGRKASSVMAERVLVTCALTIRKRGADRRGPIRAASWAMARMDQSKAAVIALLFGGHEIHDFQAELARDCANASIPFDHHFDFHPHLTLQRIAKTDRPEIGTVPRVTLTFEALSVVCGDARIDLPFGDALPDPF